MKNSIEQWDSNPVPSAYEANVLAIALQDLISIEHLKVDRISIEKNIAAGCITFLKT